METVKQQQSLVREDSSRSVVPVGQVRGKNEKLQQSHADAMFCTRCGKVPPHDFQHCPARRAICRKCQKQGHYQAVCRSGHSKRVQQVTDGTSFFLGVIGNKASKDWEIELTLNGTPVNFHIDTGAEVTLITEEAYTAIGSPVLGPSKQSLKGPNNEDLQVKGCFQG